MLLKKQKSKLNQKAMKILNWYWKWKIRKLDYSVL